MAIAYTVIMSRRGKYPLGRVLFGFPYLLMSCSQNFCFRALCPTILIFPNATTLRYAKPEITFEASVIEHALRRIHLETNTRIGLDVGAQMPFLQPLCAGIRSSIVHPEIKKRDAIGVTVARQPSPSRPLRAGMKRFCKARSSVIALSARRIVGELNESLEEIKRARAADIQKPLLVKSYPISEWSY